MSLTVPNTRSYMLATESPLLTGMENLSQILTQMDAIERTKLDEEQARYDTQLRELQERTKPPLLSNFLAQQLSEEFIYAHNLMTNHVSATAL
jgi:hypothetical protein